MNGDQVPRRLSAALRAQGSGLGTGPSTGSAPDARQVPGHPPARGRLGLPGWAAVLAGWYVTEIGRQPWIVYGELALADVVADHPPGVLLGSLLAYALLYVALLAAYVATLRHLSTKPAASLQMRAGERALGSRV